MGTKPNSVQKMLLTHAPGAKEIVEIEKEGSLGYLIVVGSEQEKEKLMALKLGNRATGQIVAIGLQYPGDRYETTGGLSYRKESS